jgi:hypothetical protein
MARHHRRALPDAVIFDLDCLIADTASGDVRAFDSTAPLLRRLRDAGVATAVYSCRYNCAEALRAVGINELTSVAFRKVETGGKFDGAVLVETAAGGRRADRRRMPWFRTATFTRAHHRGRVKATGR